MRLPRTTPGLWPWESGARMDTVAKFVSVYLRLALGTAFLSAVADRFGLWGPPGARNVGWGDFAHFISYTAQVNPWAPPAVIPVLAWLATAAETACRPPAPSRSFEILRVGCPNRFSTAISLQLFGAGCR